MKRDMKSGLDSWCSLRCSRYFAMSVSTNRSTGYRSLCCLNWRKGCVFVSRISMIPTTRTSSHFPSSSSASSALAHDPKPSLSSVRDSVKSQRRFPKHTMLACAFPGLRVSATSSRNMRVVGPRNPQFSCVYSSKFGDDEAAAAEWFRCVSATCSGRLLRDARGERTLLE